MINFVNNSRQVINETNVQEKPKYSKFSGFIKLTKLRLSLLVVFSAVITYLTTSNNFNFNVFWTLTVGGLLITSSANAFNQIIERDLDLLMNRTMRRPLPMKLLTPVESTLFAFVCGIAGVWLMFEFTNTLCGILSILSIFLYSVVYTPMKRVTPFSVFLGAIPGALPTLIGGIASTEGFGEITLHSLLLFSIQFFWQFPHFWAIAWVLHDDYQKAGFFMLPSSGGRDQSSKFQILVYTLFLIPISLTPCLFGFAGMVSAIIILICSLLFFFQAYQLLKTGDVSDARKLMFGSFVWLPVVQLILMFGI
jgi:protoheme IX farnesyltransferase